jgi:hypothetical protein
VVSVANPLPSLISTFYTGAANFSFKSLLIYLHEVKWIPFQTQCHSANLVAPGIEHETSEFGAKNSDH